MQINKSLVKGSIVLLIAFNIYNALNFFFHFAMVRIMSVVEYGVLASLFSIIYILAVFTESIQTIITKYTAKEENIGKIKNIFKKSFKKAFLVSIFLFGIYCILAIPLAHYMKIDYPLMILNGTIIILAFLSPIGRGILQGKKKFSALGINMIIESLGKFILALLFVYWGWSVYGAITATILGVIIALLLSFINISDILKKKEEKAQTEGIYGYTKPTFFIMMAILVFYSIDIIMAKIFFPDDLAGAYAIASILAKTIFFGTQPIGRAMFPLTAENNENKKKSENLFGNSLVILAIGIITALALFYFIPDLIIKVFSGKEVIESSAILFYLGISMSLMSISNLILLYKLSLGKIKGYFLLYVFIALEIFLLSWFSNDLVQFSLALVAASTAFLWGSIVLVDD
ncbi:MAG: oligosaccharide flippase family protein [Nanoarchaeota archaeon]|nr:oligosaccharide flippase family protein [Nanoarchaeota archaeon]